MNEHDQKHSVCKWDKDKEKFIVTKKVNGKTVTETHEKTFFRQDEGLRIKEVKPHKCAPATDAVGSKPRCVVCGKAELNRIDSGVKRYHKTKWKEPCPVCNKVRHLYCDKINDKRENEFWACFYCFFSKREPKQYVPDNLLQAVTKFLEKE